MSKVKAISLISLIVTIVVIILVAGITLYTGTNMLTDTRERVATETMKMVCDAISKDESAVMLNNSSASLLSTTPTVNEVLLTCDNYNAMGLSEIANETPLENINGLSVPRKKIYLSKVIANHTTDVSIPIGETRITYSFKLSKEDNASEYYIYEKTITKENESTLLLEAKFDVSKGVNMPQLTSLMTPIKYDYGGNAVEVNDIYAENWYEYIESNSLKFANMRYGSKYYVWIPRYAYKIQDFYVNNNGYSVPLSAIDIIYLQGTTDIMKNGESIPDGYVVHPAFTYNGVSIAGIWIEKTTEGTASDIATAYTTAEEIYTGNDAKSHLIKNIEWGAMTYLAQTYGSARFGAVPNNISGIGDFDNEEYVSAYLELSSGGVPTALSSANVETQNVDVYTYGGNITSVYNSNKFKKGDAMCETSANPAVISAPIWYNGDGDLPTSSNPYIVRGGENRVSLFDYNNSDGDSSAKYRAVIVVNNIEFNTAYLDTIVASIKEEVKTDVLAVVDTKTTEYKQSYPVGSFYFTTTNNNPENFLGGTWEQVSGKIMIGAGTYMDRNSITKTFSVGEIDMGEYTHQITEEEMPEHTHELSIESTSLIGGLKMNALANSKITTYFTASGIVSKSVAPVDTWYLSSSNYRLRNEVAVDGGIDRTATINATHDHTATNADTGGGTAHNNVQPHIVIYMWKKIAN